MDKTIGMVTMLQEAGAQVLCMHGRLREQRGTLSGQADIESIKITRLYLLLTLARYLFLL